MLAYDHTTAVCQKCSAHVACQAKVDEIRPKVIKLLDLFSDTNGREMSYAWLNKTERKQRKAALLDGQLIATGLTADLGDERNAPTIARAARKSVDPRTCSLADLRGLSKHLAVIVDRLQRAPATRTDLALQLREHSNLTDSSAQRTLRRELSLLISMGRVREAGRHLELL